MSLSCFRVHAILTIRYISHRLNLSHSNSRYCNLQSTEQVLPLSYILATMHVQEVISTLLILCFFLLIFRVRCSKRNMSQAEMVKMVNGSNCCSSKVVINDPKLLHQKKTAIRLAGPSKFQVFYSKPFRYLGLFTILVALIMSCH